MTYILGISGHFDSAHFLRGYKGKCAQLHGHTWKTDIEISSNELDEIGMAADFKILKNELNHILERFDHKILNDCTPFDILNPTAENLSKEIYERLKDKLRVIKNVSIKSVTVWESPTAYAKYQES